MGMLRKLLEQVPGGKRLADWHSYRRRSRKLAKIGDTKDRFTRIYEQNRWNDGESRSGIGSTVDGTAKLREELPRLVQSLGATSLLDAPCGDFNWMREVEWPAGFEYIGADIVTALIEQ